MVTARSRAVFAAFAILAGCGAARASAVLPQKSLTSTQGGARSLADLVREAPLTVVVFFSAECSCQRAHDSRLRDLYAAYHARGVQFVAVDAETTASPSRDLEEASARLYPFQMLSDPEGATADALGAESIWNG
jgi:peroxiredoxin